MFALLCVLAAAITAIEWLAVRLWGAYVAPSLHVAVFFVAFDLATGGVLLAAVARRLKADRDALRLASAEPGTQAPPALSVLVAAYNEANSDPTRGIVATVRAIAAQRGVTVEVLVGDDGSEDATYADTVRAFALTEGADGAHGSIVGVDGRPVVVRAFRFPHEGKGATLNALALRARHEVLVTMDADTTPAEGALAHLASAFLDPRVESAAGVVSVRNATSVLTRHQFAEYVKNSIIRIGWSSLGALEQVPGAFAGVRADAFRAVHGFPTDSLTEDYELTYRLVDRGLAVGRVPLVVTVPQAQAFTDVPVTVRGFVRQRTRWFAGFLSTLYRFRHLIGKRGAGGFGLVRLPLKLVDALLPILAFASLVVILRGATSGVVTLSRVAVGIFLIRWLWDLVFYAVALRFARELGDPVATRAVAPASWIGWLCTATEALTYVWLKHASTFRAYAWAARRVRTWEPSREPSVLLPAAATEDESEAVDAMAGVPSR
jgi:cellulose synthase/poly-beta-1,6-N-acetylglucosamine synthase-like glycosyltransferase